MKRSLLLMMAGTCCICANAQQRMSNSIAFKDMEQRREMMTTNGKEIKAKDLRNVYKTTATGQMRWYNYGDYLDASTSNIAFSSLYLWNDTLSMDMYTGGVLDWNTMVSVGSVLDPFILGFNDELYYPQSDNLWLTTGYPYVVDSVAIFGFYGINPAKTSVVDTITIGYAYGPGTTTTNNTQGVWKGRFDSSFAPQVLTRYGLSLGDTLWYKQLTYDSVKNTIGGVNSNSQIFTIASGAPSTNTTAGWYDTINNNIFAKAIKLNTPMNVPAGNFAGFTISFKTGDASFVPNDTVFTGHTPGTYRYNMFRPLVAHMGTTSTTIYATYNATDNNTGLFKTLPNFANGWRDRYVPLWAWTSSGGPSTYQYPYISVHVTCPTCPTVDVQNVNAQRAVARAYPNPAGDELTISFSLTKTSSAIVSLTNMVGQVVATQCADKGTSGQVTFNTASLPAGIYIYTVAAENMHYTGRAVVVH